MQSKTTFSFFKDGKSPAWCVLVLATLSDVWVILQQLHQRERSYWDRGEEADDEEFQDEADPIVVSGWQLLAVTHLTLAVNSNLTSVNNI